MLNGYTRTQCIYAVNTLGVLMKRILLSISLLLVILIIVLFYRAYFVFENNQYQVSHPALTLNIDEHAAIQRFSQAIQIQTVSYDDISNFDGKPFLAFHQFLETSYPVVHQKTAVSTFNDYSLLFHLRGTNSQLKPVLFMGHMDVVPIEQMSASQWLHHPFSGKLDDGSIWGRGSIDDKGSVIALMEAMELYLSAGNQPQRSIYFAFGHDEEVGGAGAMAIAEYFSAQKTEFEFVLDEGGIISQGLVPGTEQPIALIGIAEKGFVNLRLTVKSDGGHSSQPPNQTAAGILAKAIVKVEENPFPAKFDFFNLIFNSIGYSTGLATRLPLANLWLLEPFVMQALLAKPSAAASTRTTTAVTMLQGSNKSNVLPTVASAVVNFRILPGDTIEEIQSDIENIINDTRVQVSIELASNASSVSPVNTLGYRLIESTIRRIDDNILVAPYLVLGATDSRHFEKLSPNIYRFMMASFDSSTLKQFHGVNERLSSKDYLHSIQFYSEMIRQSAIKIRK